MKNFNCLTKRQKKIVDLFINQGEYIPAEQVADFLNISTKTVYRDLSEIRVLGKKLGITIDTKIGSGIKITSDDSDWQKPTTLDISDNYRYIEVMNYLLRIAPANVTLETLSKNFFVSKTSILSDLKQIEKYLNNYSLKISKSKRGLHIEGKEFNIRRALTASLISTNIDEIYETFEKDSRLDVSTRKILCEQFDQSLVSFIEHLVCKMEKELQFEIVNPYYINIVTHLLILVTRVMQGREIEKKDIDIKFTSIHKMRIAASVAKEIELRYSVKIPDSEVCYIYEHLDSIGYSEERIKKIGSDLVSIDKKTKEFCEELLAVMKQDLGDIRYEETIKRFVMLHVHSMLGRLRYKIDIKCSLLNEVKNNYSRLFEITKKNLSLVTSKFYPDAVLSDDEVAYVTIYFQNIIEKEKNKDLKIIVVCSSGVGTSHMLMMSIQKKFPNWTILDQLPASKLEEFIGKYENVDLIVSTVKIPNYKLNIPIAFISVLLTDRDVEIIDSVLEKGD